ncbi:lactate utilization protein [Candidatus Saccharibacteria bacterium]|nr:lactate utilization protein [Candidatus Saccharibacteria bacterium]
MQTITQNTKLDESFAQQATEEDIQIAKAGLENRGFKVFVVDDLNQLHEKVINLIPQGSEVFTATSLTLDRSKLTEELNSDKYVSVRDKFMPLYGQPDKELEMKRIGSASDYAVGSVHAITDDGQVVLASASGSQIPNYAYGAKNFIWAVGSQKLVKDLDQAIERIENYTFHLEDERAQKAYGMNSSINKILIYRNEPAGRGTVILIREAIGF